MFQSVLFLAGELITVLGHMSAKGATNALRKLPDHSVRIL